MLTVFDQKKDDASAITAVAIKTLTNANPNSAELKRFYNEYEILSLNRLSCCSSIRSALKRSRDEDVLNAIYLEWVDGITLKDWIKSSHDRYSEDRNDTTINEKDICLATACLALKVIKAVSEIHSAGVVHNDISSENILLAHHKGDAQAEENGDFQVKVIDFDFATVVESTGIDNAEGLEWESDLKSSGVVLYEMFAGEHPFPDEMDHDEIEEDKSYDVDADLIPAESTVGDDMEIRQKKRERTTTRQKKDLAYIPLDEFNVPVSLSTLVSNMIRVSHSNGTNIDSCDWYQSLEAVVEDLQLMLLDQDRFLWNPSRDHIEGVCIPNDKIYGRTGHAAILMDVYDQMVRSCGDSACELVMVSGNSGVGKTSLIQHICEQMTMAGGNYICGAFHSFQEARPFSTVANAFNEHCKVILARRDDDLENIRATIRDAVGSGGKILTDLIPNLRTIIGPYPDPGSEIRGRESQNRLKVLLQIFVRAISSPSHPLILFFDDLHNADTASLELIRLLVCDAESKSVLFIGAYRENEVDHDHPLSAQLREIMKADLNITEIKLGAIDEKSVNALISDTLHLVPRLTLSLARIVHRKTGGNPVLVVQFLTSLHDEKLLQFSLKSWRWEWNNETIQLKSVPDNAVEFIKSKIQKLSQNEQMALKIAACLGFFCDESTVSHLNEMLENDCTDIVHLLGISVREGLLDKIGSQYKFVHDQIQVAAYSQVPEQERRAMHLRIGRLIWKASAAADMEDTFFFTVANQMNRGSSFIVDYHEKVKLARLNLKAGIKSTACAAFDAAAVYMNAGISLLDYEKDWERQYDLILQLCTLCAEAESVTGNFDPMKIKLGQVFIHARCLKDKLGAYRTLLTSLSSQNKSFEAINTGLQVLSQLGEVFPEHIDKSVVHQEIMKTQRLLKRTTESSPLFELDAMEDESKLVAMEFLLLLGTHTFLEKHVCHPLIVLRTIQITILYGASKYSAQAFALFGWMLCGPLNNPKEGFRFGQLALLLLERFPSNDMFARVHLLVYAAINPIFQPIQDSLQPLLNGHKTGMLAGNMQQAMLNLQAYMRFSLLHCGKNLVQLAEEMKAFSLKLGQNKMDLLLHMILPYWQTTMNLMGHFSEDPVKLTGMAMDQDEFLSNALEKKNRKAANAVYLCSMWLAFLFHSYDLAAEMAKKCEGYITDEKIHWNQVLYYTFHDGLISVALAQKTNLKKWRNRAQKAIEKMDLWARDSKWNCQHKLELLSAEFAFYTGDQEKAARYFDNAITTAEMHSFIHDQALANERAGIFCKETGNIAMSVQYFFEALRCYQTWGAHAKALHIEGLISNLQ